MVLGLPSADVDIANSNPGTYDVPPALAAEVARFPSQAEDANLVSVPGGLAGSISPGPIPPDAITPGPVPPDAITPVPVPPDAITSVPVPPDAITSVPVPPDAITSVPVPPRSLEEDLLSQVHLTAATNLDSTLHGLPIASDRVEAPAEPALPLRPAPVPVPDPIPLEPGDYIPPPPEAAAVETVTGLEGLPPEVAAALASIPPSSPDSFGVVPVSADTKPLAVQPAAASWVRLSVDQDGGRFYAVWQVDEGDRTKARAQGGETLALRLYDVTGRPTAAPLPQAVAEQLCRDDFAQDWYLPIPQWDRIYVVEVGYLSGAGAWGAIAQSAEVAAINPA
jgi:hypothetical protein